MLPGGTAVQTDVGMTGPYDGVIGVQKELILQRFLTNMPSRFEPATGDVRLCATLDRLRCGNRPGDGRSSESCCGRNKQQPVSSSASGCA